MEWNNSQCLHNNRTITDYKNTLMLKFSLHSNPNKENLLHLNAKTIFTTGLFKPYYIYKYTWLWAANIIMGFTTLRHAMIWWIRSSEPDVYLFKNGKVFTI
jgi:hypothetical protein